MNTDQLACDEVTLFRRRLSAASTFAPPTFSDRCSAISPWHNGCGCSSLLTRCACSAPGDKPNDHRSAGRRGSPLPEQREDRRRLHREGVGIVPEAENPRRGRGRQQRIVRPFAELAVAAAGARVMHTDMRRDTAPPCAAGFSRPTANTSSWATPTTPTTTRSWGRSWPCSRTRAPTW